MPFTLSPTEAQAIQEDEAQLLNAIAQIAQRVPGVFRLGNNESGQPPTDTLRIKMGRRLVYGQLADGPFRHELDANSLKVITDALQKTVTPGINPEKYTNKIPAIEISHGGVLLFREERDGTVTTNEIYFEVAKEADQPNQQNEDAQSAAPQEPVTVASESVTSESVTVEPVTSEAITSESVTSEIVTVEPVPESNASPSPESTDNSVEVSWAHQLLNTAQYLLNPLRQTDSIYEEVAVQGYQIKKRGADIIVSEGDQVVLQARNGELVSSHVTQVDWAILGNIQVPERFPEPVPNDLPKPAANESSPIQVDTTQERDGHQAEPVSLAELDQSAAGSSENPSNNTVEATPDATINHSAIAVLERETQALPISMTRQLLQATVQDWKQQVSQRVSNRLEQGTNWIATQQSALQNQRLAHAVHRLFQRGYERTGEQSYHVRDCTITRKGQNLYVLKDAVGELMQFKTSKIMGFGRRMTILAVSDRLTAHQRQSLLTNQLDSSARPQGNLDVEAAYAAKAQKVETTVRQFLTHFAKAHTWNRENGQFKLEVGEGDTLRITDKQDGRGVVFERKNGEVFSKLGGQDFSYFERLSTKMDGMTARQSQPANSQPANSQSTNSQFANNGAKKAHTIEMD